MKLSKSGDHSRGVPPVPIPNTEVKPSCADGTAVRPWESRSLPGFFFFFFGAEPRIKRKTRLKQHKQKPPVSAQGKLKRTR